MTPTANILAGATASGKTGVCQYIAEQTGAAIISADAMLVYQGMDIGTAKPTLDERNAVPYYGLDCVTPGMSFNTSRWLDALKPIRSHTNQLIVTGGTGLYIKALIQGLDPQEETDPALRASLSTLTKDELITRLRQSGIEPETALSDPQNPRRLQRALELVLSGQPLPQRWKTVDPITLPALYYPRAILHRRIEQRVHLMYDAGLLNETMHLLATYPTWSTTAEKAIGYAEAIACSRGDITQAQAIERTIIRTRQLAKRQETWLRHQVNIHWIAPTPNATTESISETVIDYWKQHGPTTLHLFNQP